MYVVDNAVIMAAGVSSRFAPLSDEMPKGLIEVKGEVLIERQIEQLKAAGIDEIYVVVGYKAELFYYLAEKYMVKIIFNGEYMSRNNHSSIFAAKDVIRNTYICSADNYYTENPFRKEVEESFYSAVYSEGYTKEWCMHTDGEGWITKVEIGGKDAWYMIGHAFWGEDFSRDILTIIGEEYDNPKTRDMFWENFFIEHLSVLKMKTQKFPEGYIFEFDSIDELRSFDESYIENTRSRILREIAEKLGGKESEIEKITPETDFDKKVIGINFIFRSKRYNYDYYGRSLRRM